MLGVFSVMEVSNCVFYDLPQGTSYSASASTNDFSSATLQSVCFCDLTIQACNPNCDCDPDCTMNKDQLRSTYNFDYQSNSLAVETACYNKDDDQLYSVASSRMGMKKVTDNETFICVEVSNNKISDSVIKPETSVPNVYKNSGTFSQIQNDLGSYKPKTFTGYQISDNLYMNKTLSKFSLTRNDFAWRLFQHPCFGQNLGLDYFWG